VSVEYRIGDVRALLAEMPAGSVDLIVTSPPYLSLRSYLAADDPMKALEIGSERTPAEYISTLLGLTAEFRRVLAPHGSIAIELGDTFSGSGGGGGDYLPGGMREDQPGFGGSASRAREGNAAHWRAKAAGKAEWPLERSLAMIPELYRVALAYGIHPLTGEASPAGRWRVRNVVVHGRPNPPVGALGDKYRPACSYWAVACVNRRWFDLDAVRMAPKNGEVAGSIGGSTTGYRGVTDGGSRNGRNLVSNPAGAPPLDWFEDESDQFEQDLWTIPTFGYKGAHYATFAPELVRRFIVSMCPARVCRECGKPSKRITVPSEKYGALLGKSWADSEEGRPKQAGATRTNHSSQPVGMRAVSAERITTGWTDCGHGGNWRPGLVLDPFGGSGTTGMVAAGNGRDCVLFDLDGRNLDLARERIGMFLTERE
jgi:site-specific DNA-methyltransferase (adenine-specific)